MRSNVDVQFQMNTNTNSTNQQQQQHLQQTNGRNQQHQQTSFEDDHLTTYTPFNEHLSYNSILNNNNIQQSFDNFSHYSATSAANQIWGMMMNARTHVQLDDSSSELVHCRIRRREGINPSDQDRGEFARKVDGTMEEKSGMTISNLQQNSSFQKSSTWNCCYYVSQVIRVEQKKKKKNPKCFLQTFETSYHKRNVPHQDHHCRQDRQEVRPS